GSLACVFRNRWFVPRSGSGSMAAHAAGTRQANPPGNSWQGDLPEHSSPVNLMHFEMDIVRIAKIINCLSARRHGTVVINDDPSPRRDFRVERLQGDDCRFIEITIHS